MENINEVDVGDTVAYKEDKKYKIGIVRHLGKIGSQGGDDCVWSEWGREEWNGKLQSGPNGLTFMQLRSLVMMLKGPQTKGPLGDLIYKEVLRLREMK